MTSLRAKQDMSGDARLDKMKQAIMNNKGSGSTLNLIIPEDLHHRFKIKTITEKTTMTEVLTIAIEDYLRS